MDFIGILDMLHVMNEPFATERLNFLETAALSVSFLTLYFGLMFFSGWMNEGEAVFLSVIIVMMNLSFTLWSFRVIFNEQITEWLESRNVVKVAKGTKKRSGSGSKISPIKDNDMAKQNAEKAWELDSD